MDTCFPDWSNEVGVESPVAVQRKSLGLDNELVELLWQNGEVVLHSQNNRKQSYDSSKQKQVHKYDQSTTNPNSLIQDDETVTWIDCPIDESFEKEFCANFLSEIPSFDPLEPNKPSGKHENVNKFGASEVNHVGSSQQPDVAPPPRFQPGFSRKEHVGVPEFSGMTIGSSHCASNQVAYDCGIGNRTMSEETYGRKVNPQNESTERETIGQGITSCSGGSGSSFWKTSSVSNDTKRHKRKSRDAEESECISDATEMESGSRNKSSQKHGTTRRSRVAEVHNMSERRRRDRINEKMKALQELIPHSNKTDKASMLDEAIEYMKSLQLQIQLMWMGRGMAPMMLPRLGMGIGPPMFPAFQNLMRMSRLPAVEQAITMASMQNQAQVGHSPMLNYQNQMQNSGFPENYAGYMGYHSMPNTSQATNMFNIGAHQNQVLAPQDNGNGSN